MASTKLAWGLCTAVLVVACSSNDSTPTSTASPNADGGSTPIDASDGGSTATDGSNVAPTACPLREGERARLHGTIRHLDGSASPTALAGVRVCIHGRTDLPCASTDADGKYDQPCVPIGESLVHFALAGYAPTMWARWNAAQESHELSTFLLRDADNQAMFAAASVTYPRAGHGMITINDTSTTDGTKMAAVTASVEGPFYSADGVTIDTGATATVGDGLAFFVAPVGDVEIRITSAGGDPCHQLAHAWQGSADGIVKVPVLEGTETSLFVVCP